jgi:hypothetical protein
MVRQIMAAAGLSTIIACADPGAVTSPAAIGPESALTNGAPCSPEQGQVLLDAADYNKAIKEFTCVIELDPTGIDGYRGRIEAQLMLGLFSDALRDYTRVTAFVLPVNPGAIKGVVADYEARLAADPDDVPALTGQSFAYWYDFDYAAAIHVLNHLLDVAPNDVYGTLFRGSSRFLRGRTGGAADLARAIELDPESPDVRYIVADAYTYGAVPDLQRAFNEATLALEGGLDTPRVRAIRAAYYVAFGDPVAAGAEIKIHLDLVTTQLVIASSLPAGGSVTLGVVPGRTVEVPITVAAGETVSVLTSSKDYWDTILVLLAPDGTPVLGSDDYKAYFAGFVWVAPAAGTYKLRTTFFEAVNTGAILVARK